MNNLQVGDKVRVLPGADEWRKEAGFVFHGLDDTIGTFPYSKGFRMKSGRDVCLIGKFLEKIDDEYEHVKSGLASPPIGVWIEYDVNNPPEDIGHKIVIQYDTGDMQIYAHDEVQRINVSRLVEYLYLPKQQEEPPLPKCGVCGGDVLLSKIIDGSYKIYCQNDSDHLRMYAKTKEEAITNYRKQRGKGEHLRRSN